MPVSAATILKSFRTEFCGLTQVQLGAVLDMTPQTISEWENGHSEVPRPLVILIAVCRESSIKPQDVAV